MKKSLIVLLGAVVFLAACNQESSDGADDSATGNDVSTDVINNPKTANAEVNVDPATLPVMEFEVEEYDYGTITAGDVVDYTFKFTNTGKGDLVISNAKASCGCTVPYWPKEPIPPGESAEIKVSYNSKGKSGKQKKSVTITANTQPNTKVVYISGEVTPAEGTTATPAPTPVPVQQ